MAAESKLRENYKFVRQLKEVETRTKEIIPRIYHAKEQMNALKLHATQRDYRPLQKLFAFFTR